MREFSGMGQWVESSELAELEHGPGSAASARFVREGDLAYQTRILPEVSRTFALTIPQLPPRLAQVVSNAYLLCRIADAIEDDPALPVAQKLRFSQSFIQVVAGESSAEDFARALAPLLAPQIPRAERDLIVHTARVIRLTRSYADAEQEALARCVRIMADGMAEFQCNASAAGLHDIAHLNRYCYHVAGVVGEMLTTLFCEHSPAIAMHREPMMRLAVSFGQGLQMTNILKDIWDDLSRGACWLPRAHFDAHNFSLDDLGRYPTDPAFTEALRELVGIAHQHLVNALSYTLLVPSNAIGIRRFCLWALGMAILTLRKIHAYPEFRSSQAVKISRKSVKATIVSTSLLVRSDRALNALFALGSRGLPSGPRAD